MASHQRGACMVNSMCESIHAVTRHATEWAEPTLHQAGLHISSLHSTHAPPPPPHTHMHILPYTTNPWYTAWSEGRMSSLTNKYLGCRVVHSNALQDSGPIVCDLNVLTSSGSRAEEYLILRPGVGQGVGRGWGRPRVGYQRGTPCYQ